MVDRRKNDTIPDDLLDENRDIKSISLAYSYIFPDFDKEEVHEQRRHYKDNYYQEYDLNFAGKSLPE